LNVARYLVEFEIGSEDEEGELVDDGDDGGEEDGHIELVHGDHAASGCGSWETRL
jgi:hypothetical protein